MDKRGIRRLSHWMALCCICLLAVACNDEDDASIFVGRTWKIGNLMGANNRPVLTEEQAATVAKENSFYIRFESLTSFTGRTLDKEFYGTCKIDLGNQKLSLTFKNTGNPSDNVSKLVIRALQNTASYTGDYNVLNLKEAESSAYVLCRPY